MQINYYSIIDIGSNTIRLVIYKQKLNGRLHEVENVKAVARLRNYLNSENILSDQGIEVLINTLKSFKEIIKDYKLEDFVCAATATIRQAKNKVAIERIIEEQIGWKIKVISEQEEAFYGYLAVVNSTTIREGIAVDIGGGSTEVIYFKNRKLIKSHSFPFGVLTLKDLFSAENNQVKLRKYLLEQFNKLGWLKNKDLPLIGIGGSARNMVQIDQNMIQYRLAGQHQYKMFDSDIARISNYLSSLSFEELQKVEGLSKERTDTIIPAIEVFHCLYKITNARSFILSRKGLRDGIFYERLIKEAETPLFPDVLANSINDLILDYELNLDEIKHMQLLTRKLFTSLQSKGIGSLTSQDWKLLERGCYVFYLGNYIDSEASAQHTFYLLSNRNIDGLMHIDRLKLALISSFKSKILFKQFLEPYKDLFLKDERIKLRLMGALLKFAYSLDATKRQVVQDISMKIKGKTVIFTIFCNKDFLSEQYQSEKQKKHLEKIIDKDIKLVFVNKIS